MGGKRGEKNLPVFFSSVQNPIAIGYPNQLDCARPVMGGDAVISIPLPIFKKWTDERRKACASMYAEKLSQKD